MSFRQHSGYIVVFVFREQTFYWICLYLKIITCRDTNQQSGGKALKSQLLNNNSTGKLGDSTNCFIGAVAPIDWALTPVNGTVV